MHCNWKIPFPSADRILTLLSWNASLDCPFVFARFSSDHKIIQCWDHLWYKAIHHSNQCISEEKNLLASWHNIQCTRTERFLSHLQTGYWHSSHEMPLWTACSREILSRMSFHNYSDTLLELKDSFPICRQDTDTPLMKCLFGLHALVRYWVECLFTTTRTRCSSTFQAFHVVWSICPRVMQDLQSMKYICVIESLKHFKMCGRFALLCISSISIFWTHVLPQAVASIA